MTNRNNLPASPPCSLHELAPEEQGTATADVAAWRSAERKRLRALQDGVQSHERQAADAQIGRHLERMIADAVSDAGKPLDAVQVAVFWPLAREPDLRSYYVKLAGWGLNLALPVVTQRDASLTFRQWQPGSELLPDLLGIPAAQGQEILPDILIVPCVGFDDGCFRLGNGGGYYDRTLADMTERPLFIGVSYESSRLRTIYPQPHDVAMQAVITESAVRHAEPAAP